MQAASLLKKTISTMPFCREASRFCRTCIFSKIDDTHLIRRKREEMKGTCKEMKGTRKTMKGTRKKMKGK